MLISFGLAFQVIQFATQFGFYPEALMRDHPMSQIAFHQEQFVLSVFLFYKQSLEISTVIWQSLLLAAAVLYLPLRKHLHFGALIVICVVEKLWIGGEVSSDLMELLLIVLASAAAGLAGDVLIAKLRPSWKKPAAFRLLGFVVAVSLLSGLPRACGADVRRDVVGRELRLRLDRPGRNRRCLHQPALARRIATDQQLGMRPRLAPIAYAFALATAAAHLIFNHRFGYYRDELYFIDCAKHLAWGYVDQPPLAPLAAWVTAPLGYPVWGLRLFPGILAGVTVLLGCAIAREFGGRAFAQGITALTIALGPALAGLGYGLSTEFLSPAAWTALIYLTIRLVKTEDERLYLPIALVVTLGIYAKYSIAACAVALLLGLLFTGHARLLRSRWLAFALLLTLLLTLPNALWQIRHGLPMLEVLQNDQLNRHALANGMADESPNRWLNALFMLALQLLYQNLFFAPIWIWGLIWLTKQYRFLAVAYVLTLALLILTIGRGYYIEGFYPALFAAGGTAIEAALNSRARWLKPALAGAILATGLPFLPFTLPLLPLPAYMAYERAIGLSRPAPPDGTRHLINPLFADQLGWKTMTQTVAGAYWSLPAAQRAITGVFADRYAYAGALNYYGPRYGLPPVISPNNSYYLWGTRGYGSVSLLAVGATDYRLLLRWFGSVRQIAVYRNDYRWMLEGPLPIYLCTKPRAPLAVIWPALKYYGL